MERRKFLKLAGICFVAATVPVIAMAGHLAPDRKVAVFLLPDTLKKGKYLLSYRLKIGGASQWTAYHHNLEFEKEMPLEILFPEGENYIEMDYLKIQVANENEILLGHNWQPSPITFGVTHEKESKQEARTRHYSRRQPDHWYAK